MRALSLFCGAGGLDYGASLAGARTCLATDIDSAAAAVAETVTGARTVVGDLGALLTEGELSSKWAGPPPDILLGGPPCTAFSHAGFWLQYKREGDDPAAEALWAYLEAVRRFRPRGFVMENVPGLTFKNHRHRLIELERQLRDLGYSLSRQILKASDFGVAQARRRVFVVGILDGEAVRLDDWPQWPTRTAAWALEGLGERCPPESDEAPSGKYAELLRQVPPGSNYLFHTAERGSPSPVFRYRGRYWSFLLKASPERPSPTIPAQRVTWNGPFHWSGRHLRVGELARLQSFPDGYPFTADLHASRRQIGNAVPPLMACAVVWRLIAAIGGDTHLPPVLERLSDSSLSYGEVMPAFGGAGG